MVIEEEKQNKEKIIKDLEERNKLMEEELDRNKKREEKRRKILEERNQSALNRQIITNSNDTHEWLKSKLINCLIF